MKWIAWFWFLMAMTASIAAQEREPGAPHQVTPKVSEPAGARIWLLNQTDRIGGIPVRLQGTPHVVDSDHGRAVEFDGVGDAILVNMDPLEGLRQFTIEVLFKPAASGYREQRFFHLQENEGQNRVLLELRWNDSGKWYADTFIKSDESSRTLRDETLLHPAEQWHTMALVCDGKKMIQYVDGRRELEGEVAYKAHRAGSTAIGVRLNLQFWYKGLIREARITPMALAPRDLMRP